MAKFQRNAGVLLALVLLTVAGPRVVAGAEDGGVAAIRQAIDAAGRSFVIVRLKADAPSGPTAAAPTRSAIASRQEALDRRLDGRGWIPRRRMVTVPLVTGFVDAQGLVALAAAPEVAGVYPDSPVQGALAESGAAIGAAYVVGQLGLDGDGIAVGLVDTGIDLNHPDLPASTTLIAGRRFLGQGADVGADVQDDNGHGARMAGILTGDGQVAPPGIAPGCRLVVVKALDADNSGYLSDVIAGIDWMIDNHDQFPTLKFINLSLTVGGPLPAQCPCDGLPEFQTFSPLIERAAAAGIFLVGAAGNDGALTVLRAPAGFSGVVSVGASFDQAFDRAPSEGFYSDQAALFPDAYDDHPLIHELTAFTNRGQCLDFVAPGYLITSATLGGGQGAAFGSSMAAAHATSALALMQSVAPEASAEELMTTLAETAAPVFDPASGLTYKRIDARAAVEFLTRNTALHWSAYQ